ncbi:MAG: UDP-glucose 4-epimerase GalE [Parvibaculaceae bacterium]|nr:UDP-glucose 4-epimerase GalE [Parvibaculaceae bacterium]
MSTLVTGGAGYIGSHMVLNLADAGEEVAVIDNLSTGFQWAVHPSAHLYQGDIADEALLDKVIRDHRVTSIIHFAGSIVVPESLADPLKYYFNNTANSRTLIERAVKGGVENFIFSSTAAVYGMPDADMVDEDAVLKPISPYGTSKLMTEWMLRDTAHAHGLKYAALRYFNVAGADARGRTGQSTASATHLIKVASQAALGLRSHIEVYGQDYPTRDGTCIRDYIHVADLANAHSAALAHLRTGGESFVANCGYGKGFSVNEVLASVERVSGKSFDIRHGSRRPGDPARLVSNPARLKSLVDWKPAYEDLDTIVAHALAWEDRLTRTHRNDAE